jgi:hypothetical protein
MVVGDETWSIFASMPDLELVPLDGEYYVHRLASDASVPEPVSEGFWSLTRTAEEISIVCGYPVPGARTEGPWAAFRVAGVLDFTLTGILHHLLAPLAAARISIFSLSTFDTDYILVPQGSRHEAIESWRESGITVAE